MQGINIAALQKALIVAIAGVFITIVMVGPALCMISQETGCQFMGENNIMCQTNIINHIAEWNQMLVTIVPGVIALLSLVFAVFFSIPALVGGVNPLQNSIIGYLRGHPDIGRNRKIFTALQRGLIHPIVYA